MGKRGYQGVEKAGTFHQFGSVAAQPAALSAALQRFVDDVKNFGRWPAQKGTATFEEKWLAKRLQKHMSNIPREIQNELLLLSGAPQPAAPSSSSSVAPQPAAMTATVQRLVDDIKNFGRLPTQAQTASPKEKLLARTFGKHRSKIPHVVMEAGMTMMQDNQDGHPNTAFFILQIWMTTDRDRTNGQ